MLKAKKLSEQVAELENNFAYQLEYNDRVIRERKDYKELCESQRKEIVSLQLQNQNLASDYDWLKEMTGLSFLLWFIFLAASTVEYWTLWIKSLLSFN
jgi:hypothetical protein